MNLGKLSFIERNENVIIIGPPVVEKSMLATGIGINACKAGYKVLFINAKDLIDRLYEGMTQGKLARLLCQHNKVELLIIDELSYLKLGKEKERIFFSNHPPTI